MALVTHQIQGSYAPWRHVTWKRQIESDQFLAALPAVERRSRFIVLKHRSCLCLGVPVILGSRWKSLRISSFKGSVQHDESEGRANGSKSVKDSVKVSYVSHESEEIVSESTNGQNVHLTSTSDEGETMTRSLAIRNLFRSWLTLLRTPIPSLMDETLEESPSKEASEPENRTQNSGGGEILKAVWCNFLGLDATIKIPVMIFIPMYLAVNMKYGPEISKELTPLWILGPLVVALYIKMFRGICSLYVFSFKQTIKLVTNLPTYYLVAYDYVARGKLKEIVRANLLQPVVDIRNLDYKEVSRRKMEDFKVWVVDKYLDYVESIWPYYCKIIRFLKRANLI